MHKKFNSDNKAVYLKERTWILSVSYAEEKTYIITTFSASCDKFFTCFLFILRQTKIYIYIYISCGANFSWDMIFGTFPGFRKDL